MPVYKYKCTLVSDVILNQKSSSEGPQNTLDFIPGNNFLGIAASYIYPSEKHSDEDKLRLFHTGEVRFSDAHPACGNIRTLKVPSSLYYPKQKKASDETYVWHRHDSSVETQDLQLKQCRNGFYAFIDGNAKKVEISKSFAIKSAYDRDLRKSKDSQMYGYESLSRGQEFFFEVSFADTVDEGLRKAVSDSLCGDRFIGRSKSAQYGHVKISMAGYEEPVSHNADNGLATVYADGRLIFIDEYGIPTFRPTAQDLGFAGDAEIIWEKSQIRTFQYSPWNAKRQSWDMDRCGIEKGSVFVVKCIESPDSASYVGLYKNEGFGKVIYNPDFLEAEEGTNGRSRYTLIEDGEEEKQPVLKNGNKEICEFNKKFVAAVIGQYNSANASEKMYKEVNGFVEENVRKFRDEDFASQWGLIREKATTSPDYGSFRKELEMIVTKGVSSDKWQENGRSLGLNEFIGSLKEEKNWRMIVVNLCSEMGKKCKNR